MRIVDSGGATTTAPRGRDIGVGGGRARRDLGEVELQLQSHRDALARIDSHARLVRLLLPKLWSLLGERHFLESQASIERCVEGEVAERHEREVLSSAASCPTDYLPHERRPNPDASVFWKNRDLPQVGHGVLECAKCKPNDPTTAPRHPQASLCACAPQGSRGRRNRRNALWYVLLRIQTGRGEFDLGNCCQVGTRTECNDVTFGVHDTTHSKGLDPTLPRVGDVVRPIELRCPKTPWGAASLRSGNALGTWRWGPRSRGSPTRRGRAARSPPLLQRIAAARLG